MEIRIEAPKEKTVPPAGTSFRAGTCVEIKPTIAPRMTPAIRALELPFLRSRAAVIVAPASGPAPSVYNYVEAVNEKDCVACGQCENSCPDFVIHVEKDA